MGCARSLSSRVLSVVLGVMLALIRIPVAVGEQQPLTETLMRPLSFGATVQRVQGCDRFATSVAVSGMRSGAATCVVIASGRDFPDALVATPLATALNAPLLLTEPDGLPPAVAGEIRRLGAVSAVIIGGEHAVSIDVERDLSRAGVRPGRIERLAGADRYETAAVVARRVAATTGGCPGAVLATGGQFADALSASAFAGATARPILLTRLGALPASASEVIDELELRATLVVGGERAIAFAVEASVPDPTRVGGADRYDTARLMAEYAFLRGVDYARVAVAVGDAFPDAICAGAWAASVRGQIILTDGEIASAGARDFFSAHGTSVESIVVVGGSRAVNDSVASDLAGAARTRLSSDVVMLGYGARSALETITPDRRRMRFASDAPEVRSLVASDVLVAGPCRTAPDGYLVRVLRVVDDGDSVSVETTAATLADVIVQGSIDITGSVTPEPLREGSSLGVEPSASMGTELEIPFESSFSRAGEPVDGCDATAAVTVEGSASLEGSFALNASWGHLYYESHWWGLTSVSGLQSVTFTTYLQEELVLDMCAEMEAKWSVDIIDAVQERLGREIGVQVGSTWFWVGWVPVNITFCARPVATLDLQAEAAAELGFTQRSSALYGLRYDYGQGWRPIRWAWSGFDVRGPDLRGSVDADLEVGVVLDCLFYNVAGPYFGLSGTLGLDADTAAVPWWITRVDVNGVYGGRFEIFGAKASCGGSVLFYSRTLDQADGGFAPA